MIVVFKDGTQKEIKSFSEIEFLPSSGYIIAVDGKGFDRLEISYDELVSQMFFGYIRARNENQF